MGAHSVKRRFTCAIHKVFDNCPNLHFPSLALRLAVAFKATVLAHAVVERDLATVSEGWMAEIVGEADRLDHGEIGEVDRG